MGEGTTYRIMGAEVWTDGEDAVIKASSPWVQKESDEELVKEAAVKRHNNS